jgi:hypothetical protein
MLPQLLRISMIAVGVLGNLVAVPHFAPGHAQALSTDCRAADQERVPHMLGYFKELLSTTDSTERAVRDSLGLSATPPAKIKFVTKRTVCVQAAKALNALLGQPGVGRNLWVYQLGDNYAVEDPDIPGRRYELFVFSETFVYRGTLVGI